MGDSTPTPVLVFTQSDADEIYNELRDLHMDLDADPLVFGPKRLNQKVAQVRGMLDRCERIFLDVAQRLHRAKRELRIAATTLELAKRYLFANDPETRAGRSVGDREAIATGKLKEDVTRTNHLDLMVQDLDAVIVVIKAKRSDLRDTQGRLRDQVRLCQEEIGLGSRWGSRSPKKGPDLKPSEVDGSRDIDDLLGSVDGEIHLGAKQGGWEEPDEFQFEPTEDVVEPDPKPDPKPELEEDEPIDSGEILPPTSSVDEVESFLDEPEPLNKQQDQPPKPTRLDETALNDILANFEKMD
jgi:hypothetical protein